MNRNSVMRLGAAIMICGLTAGCSAIAPTAIVTASGPAYPAATEGQFKRFAERYKTAEDSTGEDAPKQMLLAGLSLVNVNCQDFFRQRGKMQTQLLFLRDTLAAALPLATTGTISLIGTGGSATPILALIQSGATGAINVAATNFLFGAENIDDVRELTLNALAAHSSTVRALQDTYRTEATFDWAISQITDAQEICQPPRILALSKVAIAKANMVATTTASAGTPNTENPSAPAVAPATAPKAAAPAASAPQSKMPNRVLVRVTQ